VANEHILKRQQQNSSLNEEKKVSSIEQSSSQATKFSNLRKLSTNSSGSSGSSAYGGKTELEYAIENRFKRQSQSIEPAAVQSSHPPPPPPLPQAFKVPGSPPLPTPPSPQALERLNSNEQQQRPSCPPPPPPIAPFLNGTAPATCKQPQTVKQMITNANNSINSSNNSGLHSQGGPLTRHSVQDPRSSSDFSALIAKKAAEKRAAFNEVPKPSVNAVTFQGGEVSSGEQNVVKIQVEKPKIVAKPAVPSCQPVVANVVKQNNFSKVTVGPIVGSSNSVTIVSGVKAKVNIFQTPPPPPPLPDNGN